MSIFFRLLYRDCFSFILALNWFTGSVDEEQPSALGEVVSEVLGVQLDDLSLLGEGVSRRDGNEENESNEDLHRFYLRILEILFIYFLFSFTYLRSLFEINS